MDTHTQIHYIIYVNFSWSSHAVKFLNQWIHRLNSVCVLKDIVVQEIQESTQEVLLLDKNDNTADRKKNTLRRKTKEAILC